MAGAAAISSAQYTRHTPGTFRMPSLIPLTVYTAIVPLAGILIFLFTLEQLVNGWKHGFAGPEDQDDSRELVE